MKETGNYSGEGIFEAQDAPADLRIGVSAQSRQWSGSADEPGFYFLPVKKRIIALNDSVLHQKGGASGYKRSCHRGTGAGIVPPPTEVLVTLTPGAARSGLVSERAVNPCPEKEAS